MFKKTVIQSLKTEKSFLSEKMVHRKLYAESLKTNNKCTQDFTEIKDIIGGTCFLSNGSIITVLEILPVNFIEKKPYEKDSIADFFGLSFKQLPKNGHIKIMNARTDMESYEKNIREAMRGETNSLLLERVEDHIEHTRFLQKESSVCTRCFFIFEYEGDEDTGKKSENWDEIMEQIRSDITSICDAFYNMGNKVIPMLYNSTDLASILYEYFNPKSIDDEGFKQRQAIVQSAASYCAVHDTGATYAPAADYIASRGIRFGKWDYVVIDGVYQTYLALKDTSHPNSCTTTWLSSIFSKMTNADMDLHYRMSDLNTELNSFFMDRVNVISQGVSLTQGGEENRQEALLSTAANAKYIKDRLDADEDLYEVCIIFTLRAPSYKALKREKRQFIKQMKTMHYYFEDSFLRAEKFFQSTLPYMYCDETIFRENRRNYTNTSLASLYCFTSNGNYSPDAVVLGTAYKTGAIYSLDNFNTKLYANPHIFIAGTTGAGKTYTECMLGTRMRIKGIRTMYILPFKGYEYRDNILSLGGTFTSLRPGGTACINVCEIRPESVFHGENVSDEEARHAYEETPSLLAKKTSSLITWIRMLMSGERMTIEESGELNFRITNVYHQFGITEDNNSIYDENGKLKVMPIIGDLYNEIAKSDIDMTRILSVLKPWVFGNCRNMNGQTNVDVENKCTAYDINKDIIPEELLPGFMYIAYDLCCDLAKRDEYEKCAIFLDEAWILLQIIECAKKIFEMIKILRGYATCVVCATQDIEDCMNHEYGRSILTLSAIKIYLKVNDQEIETLGSCMVLSPENKALIQKAPQGYGFVCANADHTFVHFESSDLEHLLYTTDINEKKRLKKEREAMKRKLNSNTIVGTQ